MSAKPSRLFVAGPVGTSLSFYLPAVVTYRVAGLARGVILAWVMTGHAFGIFQLTLVAMNILLPLCALGTYEGLARYVPLYETRGQLRRYLRTALLGCLDISLALCAIGILVRPWLAPIIYASLGRDSDFAAQRTTYELLTAVTMASIFILIGYHVFQSILRGLRMYWAVTLMELISNLLFTVLAVGSALLGNGSALAILICYIVTFGLVTTAFATGLFRTLNRMPRQDQPLEAETSTGSAFFPVQAQLLGFGVWAGMAMVMWQIMQHYPIWYLQKMTEPQVVAIFGAVRSVTQAALIGASSVVALVQTAVTKTWESKGRAIAERQLTLAHKATLLAVFAGSAMIALASPLVIRIFPAGYRAGESIIPLTLAFFMIGGHLAFLVVHFVLHEKTRFIFALWVLGAIGNAVFAAVLVTPGMATETALIAAAWAGAAGMTVALLAGLAFLRITRSRVDRGTWLLIAVPYVLALDAGIAGLAATAFILAAMGTGLLFDTAEKQQILATARQLRAKLHRRGETNSME